MSTAREEILARIRGAVGAEGSPAPARAWPIPARARGDAPTLRRRFADGLEAAGASLAAVARPGDVAAAVVRHIAGLGRPLEAVAAPDTALDGCGWQEVPELTLRRGRPGPDDAVGITPAAAGIAETGTIMVRSGPGLPNALHFLPDVHVAVLAASAIVGGYEDAFARLGADPGGLPRNVTLITGPSRSSDIERILQIGVHGPRALHVVLVDGA